MAKHEDTATTMLKMMEMFLETTKKMEERALKMEERAERREQKMEERAEKREQLLLERLAGSGGIASVPAQDTATVAAALASRIVMFEYDEDTGCTFDKWITRFEDVVKSEGSSLEEADRTSLLVSKLDSRSYAMYVDHILPKKPADASYEETTTVLEELFGEKCSLFRRRFNAFRVVKEETEDFKTYAARVNQLHERGRVKEMSEDDCKCMLFVAGMQEGKWKDLRKRLIRRLEVGAGEGTKLRDLVTECELSMSLVKDAVVHVQEENAFVARVNNKKWNQRKFSPVRCSPSKDHDRNKDYSRKKGACFLCGETGHYANSCAAVRNVKAVARLKNGRKDVTACIGKDELDVVMQLDTGADVTIVDRKTWRRLGSPSLGMTSVELRAANGSTIEVDGVFNTVFKVNGFPGKGRCYVTKDIRLMGMEWIEQLPSFQEAFATTCCAVKSAGSGKESSGRRPNVRKVHDLQGSGTRMEQDCNRQHGVKRDFVVDDLVFVRDYRKPTKPTWTPGRVVRTRGKSLCEVEISKKVVWTCYTRDLRPRSSEEQEEDALTILLEDFDLAWPTKKKLSGVVVEEPIVDVQPSLKLSEETTVDEEQRLEGSREGKKTLHCDECAEPTEEDAVEKTADQEDTNERPRAVQFSEEEEESMGMEVDDSGGSRRTGSSTREGRSPVLAAAGQRPRRDRAPPRRLDMDPRQKKYKLI